MTSINVPSFGICLHCTTAAFVSKQVVRLPTQLQCGYQKHIAAVLVTKQHLLLHFKPDRLLGCRCINAIRQELASCYLQAVFKAFSDVQIAS